MLIVLLLVYLVLRYIDEVITLISHRINATFHSEQASSSSSGAGVIQQLRGPKFNNFWPSSPRVDRNGPFHTIYSMSHDHWSPPPSSRPRSYRMTPQPAWCKTASTCTVSGRFSQELHHHGGGNTICPADFELLSRKLCQNDVACSDVVQLKFLF